MAIEVDEYQNLKIPNHLTMMYQPIKTLKYFTHHGKFFELISDVSISRLQKNTQIYKIDIPKDM